MRIAAVLVFLAIVALVAINPANPAKAMKSVASTPKCSCHVCQGPGPDCQSQVVNTTCDKCVKFTGVSTGDTKEVPDFIWQNMNMNTQTAKDQMVKNKGKQMTFRGCATQGLIDVATLGDSYSDTGCSDYDEFFGFKDVTACLCKGDC